MPMTGWLCAAARVRVTPDAKAKSTDPAITALVAAMPVMTGIFTSSPSLLKMPASSAM